LNSLSILIRARPPIANKILNAILNFNPLKLANSPMTPKLRVIVKSIEKTTRMLLININKRYGLCDSGSEATLTDHRDPQNPFAMRIHQQVERLMRSRTEIFDEATRKRGPPELVDGLDSAKRQRLGATVTPTPASRLHIPSLTPGPHTVAELFTISSEEGLKTFDVSVLPEDIIIKITATILSRVDESTFTQAVNV
jgi:symplekin